MTPSWMTRAACTGMDVALFFPSDAEPIAREAAAACSRCPVAAECLAYAVERREHGVWAGLTARQHNRTAGSRAASRQRDRELFYGCGTPAAYARHIRAHQTPCEPCREAERARRGRLPSRARRTA